MRDLNVTKFYRTNSCTKKSFTGLVRRLLKSQFAQFNMNVRTSVSTYMYFVFKQA